jgi:hypothetical protein
VAANEIATVDLSLLAGRVEDLERGFFLGRVIFCLSGSEKHDGFVVAALEVSAIASLLCSLIS